MFHHQRCLRASDLNSSAVNSVFSVGPYRPQVHPAATIAERTSNAAFQKRSCGRAERSRAGR
jgi:hypothetical protein